MRIVHNKGCTLHARSDGPEDGRVLMLANSLGTDLRVWDPMMAHLPDGLRVIRFDNRGHGLSDCSKPPYEMDTLVLDAAAVADAMGVRDVTFVGLSIGGLIGQGLAAARPDLVSALVLMDTAAKIGTSEMWSERIALARADGLGAMADAVLDRWFSPAFRSNAEAVALWRNMLSRTPLDGYVGCCAAIAGADFTDDTAKLTIPVMAMTGGVDLSTPPELVRATAQMCGADFHVIEDAGHLPCIEKPAEVAALITQFLKDTQ